MEMIYWQNACLSPQTRGNSPMVRVQDHLRGISAFRFTISWFDITGLILENTRTNVTLNLHDEGQVFLLLTAQLGVIITHHLEISGIGRTTGYTRPILTVDHDMLPQMNGQTLIAAGMISRHPGVRMAILKINGLLTHRTEETRGYLHLIRHMLIYHIHLQTATFNLDSGQLAHITQLRRHILLRHLGGRAFLNIYRRQNQGPNLLL